MRLVAFFAVCAICAGGCLVEAETVEEPAAFRESNFMSEVEQDAGLPQSVRVGGVVFVSAMTSPGESFERQAKTIYIRLQSCLAQYGLSMRDVAQERVYLGSMSDYEQLVELRRLYYRGNAVPAFSCVQVSGFPQEGALLSIELMAVANPEEEE
ncbi:RidA family protein [Pelagicoccus sp. SDUM812003]|uniref:RidA family protein n=1 Tax=Pelagicoccus sp. SDUM812003 TaxID=3041267 RepID=UPI00280F5CF3|nr:RidA family protein [Pelagicoccus sp. SDUM812003]MDQ8203187.1 RidA family protein [Pelagicoccus sp. SDUM812003]